VASDAVANGGRGPELRRLLHDANAELSIAVLQLELLLEESALDPVARSSIEEALQACKSVAAGLRTAWGLVDR
jgi:hypothetical protein